MTHRAAEIRMIKRSLALVFCALLLPAAAAQDYPKLKPGLWELTRSSQHSSTGQAMKICLDESLQREMYQMGVGPMNSMCSKHDFRISGNRGTGDFVCTVNGSTMHSKSAMTINGDVGYRTEVDTTFDPPLNGQSKVHSVMEARYTGPCAAGQQPGDVTLPNGQTINMRQMLKGRTQP